MAGSSRNHVIILGAGRSVAGNLPSAMVNVDANERLLDWLLAAFAVLDSPDVRYVCGYKAGIVESLYPDIRCFFNPDWRATGPARSLAAVPLAKRATSYISYSDVVFRPQAVQRVMDVDAECVLAVDSTWRIRFDRRSGADIAGAEKVICRGDTAIDIGKHIPASEASAEFAGLMRFSGGAAAQLAEVLERREFGQADGLPELIRLLIRRSVHPRIVDVGGDWAELNAPQDLARFVLGTKAESLARLKPLVRTGRIDDLLVFSGHEWTTGRKTVVNRIQELFSDSSVIVRSSAINEDGWQSSGAGAFMSVPNIPTVDSNALTAAIEEVFRSYAEQSDDNQILVQKMLSDVRSSGVVMTRTPARGAPYYVINFDDTSSRTDVVTSGGRGAHRSIYLYRTASLRADLPADLFRLMDIVAELESLVGHDSLDVEFAFSGDGVGHVLQVRPIAVARVGHASDDEQIAEALPKAAAYFRELQQPKPFIFGSSTRLSLMTDWNPAEMIGAKPNRLAFSLYRLLITDEAWARQRAEYGYRDVRPNNLIVDILGHPYVDVRVDFNSFVPAALPDELAEKLVEYYLGELSRVPESHDKVEFDVLMTCIGFDFEDRAGRLLQAGFSVREVDVFRRALVDITEAAFGRCRSDFEKIEQISSRYEAIVAQDLGPLERANVLLQDVRRLAIPAFSHLARHAFVSATLLRSLESAGHITNDEHNAFLGSVRTIPSGMMSDARSVTSGELDWARFVGRYGHLRPGSYDITSPCYASAPEFFLRPMLHAKHGPEEDESWRPGTRERIGRELAVLGLSARFEVFESFLRQSIEGRELCKFVFMRNVNAALEALAEFGADHGASREDLAQIRISDLLAFRGAGIESAGESLARLARTGYEVSAVTQSISLPAQISHEDDFFCFEQMKAEPNFVSQKRIQAEMVTLVGGAMPDIDVSGKIVLIPNADPGFDWLFARGIAGLMTMYGGANSHMTIRASELQLPAAIGIGEVLYETLNEAQLIELNCATRQIKVIR